MKGWGDINPRGQTDLGKGPVSGFFARAYSKFTHARQSERQVRATLLPEVQRWVSLSMATVTNNPRNP